MTPQDCLSLSAGDQVLVVWPGTADGTGYKRARVAKVSPDGSRVRVYVARVDSRGEYTGAYGASPRSFYSYEVVVAA